MISEHLFGFLASSAVLAIQQAEQQAQYHNATAEQTREDNQKLFERLHQQYEQQKPKRYQGDFEDVEFTEQERGENVEQRRSLTDGRPEDPAALPTDNA